MSDASLQSRDPILWEAILATAQYCYLTQGADGWPDVPTVVRFSQAFQVPEAILGSYFGLLQVTDEAGKDVWLDCARGMSPGVNGPMPLKELDAESGFAWFRGFCRAFGRPVPRLPLNGYTAELPRRPVLRVVG